MQKQTSSPIPTLLLGIFFIILLINTTFNWGSNGSLFLWLILTVLIGWFVIAIQNRMHKAR